MATQKEVAYIQVPNVAQAYLVDQCICYDTNGRAVDPADTSGYVYAGTCLQAVASATQDTVKVPVMPPSEANRFQKVTLTGATQADVGELSYFTGVSTVTKSVGNGVKAGLIVALLGTNLVLIDTMRTL